MKRLPSPEILHLDVFEGSLNFLWHLIQQNEIHIHEILLQKITKQYLEKLAPLTTLDVDDGGEFIATTASLLCLKSKMLLPKHDQTQTVQNEESDRPFDMIPQLIDYCRFKQAAKILAEREQGQSACFFRGREETMEVKKHTDAHHLSLDDLAALFQQMLAKAPKKKGQIHEEVWRVADKIYAIRNLLKDLQKIPFELLFSSESCREELIVTFLAVLELIKLGEMRVIQDPATYAIFEAVKMVNANA